MIGPYTVASSARRRCGRVLPHASWCKLPIKGNFVGPGGKLFCVCFFKRLNNIIRKIMKSAKHNQEISMIELNIT